MNSKSTPSRTIRRYSIALLLLAVVIQILSVILLYSGFSLFNVYAVHMICGFVIFGLLVVHLVLFGKSLKVTLFPKSS